MQAMNDALNQVREWMKSNRLKLNPDKTQFIWIGGRAQLKKINFVELLRVPRFDISGYGG
jgi:hypothetical protein